MYISATRGNTVTLLSVTALCGCLSALTSPAFAKKVVMANKSPGVEEVIVTAQKRTESLVNVPVSVVALSGNALRKSGVDSMSSLPDLVPSLHIDSSGAFFQPSIRGIGTAIAGAGASANVAIYVDGIYHPNALASDFNFIDVKSIQVLKGPQGTLFGRNATGGAILITTKSPSFEREFDMRVGYGSFNTFTGSMFLSDKVTNKVAISLAVGGRVSDGWIKNLQNNSNANPSQDLTGHLKILYKPSHDWKFTLSLDAFRQDDPTLYAASSFNGWSNAAFFGVPLAINNSRKVRLDGHIAHVAEGHGLALTSQVNLGFATLTSYTAGHWDSGHEYTNELAAPFPVNGTLPSSPAVQLIVDNADWNYTESTYSQEFDLGQSGIGPLDWVTGLFLFYDKSTYSPFNLGLYGPLGAGGILSAPYPWPASAYINTGDQKFSAFSGRSYSYAAFADATYNWGRWHFTLGGRYSIDRAGINFTSFPSIANGFSSVSGLKNHHDFYSLTPRAVVRYSLTENSNVYASWSQGTKAGLFNASGYLTQRTPLAPEKLTDIEGGYKITGDGWHLEASAFHYDYRNLQVSTYVGGLAFFQNAPKAELYGGDISWDQQLTQGLIANIGLAYTHSQYINFPSAALQYFDPILGVVNSSTNVDGKQMERTPKFSGTFNLTYNTPLNGGDLELSGNYSYRTKVSFDFPGTFGQGAYGLLNLHAGWTTPSGKWTFSVTGTNVTDEKYLIQVLPNAGGFGAVYGEPAAVMFQIGYAG